ncbi:MAG: hypothetical protein U0354_05740 [Candidatus Sericytochromatia bacterium]
MKVELTKQQVDSLIIAMDSSIAQLGSARNKYDKYVDDIEKDLTYLKKIRDKINKINPDDFIPMTKYEMYNLISIASNYQGLHEQPQDNKVNNVVKVKDNILDIIKSPLPYIDIIFIRIEKKEMESK